MDMEAQVDNYELRPLVDLWTPPVVRMFPMWFQLYRVGDEFWCIDISDYTTPIPGTIFKIGDRLFEFIEAVESRPSRGNYSNELGSIETPTWFKVKCSEVTGSKLKYAGEDNTGMVLINLNSNN